MCVPDEVRLEVGVGKLGNNFMINSRIFSMTYATTTMLNTNILDVLSNMSSSKIHANISIACLIKLFIYLCALDLACSPLLVDALAK